MQKKMASLAVQSITGLPAFAEKTKWYYGVVSGETPIPVQEAWNKNRVVIYKSRSAGMTAFFNHHRQRLLPPSMTITIGEEAALVRSLIQLQSDCLSALPPKSCAVLSAK